MGDPIKAYELSDNLTKRGHSILIFVRDSGIRERTVFSGTIEEDQTAVYQRTEGQRARIIGPNDEELYRRETRQTTPDVYERSLNNFVA